MLEYDRAVRSMPLKFLNISAAFCFAALGSFLATPALAQSISFAKTVNIAAGGSAPHALAAGDFNGDGKLDLVAANFIGKNVTLLLGTGSGTFAAPTPITTFSTGPVAIVAADFDGDGNLDLAIANDVDANVYILRGRGDGTFANAPTVGLGLTASDIHNHSFAVGDFNGDGMLDIAVTSDVGATNGLSILLGNGDGTFSTPTPPTTAKRPQFVTAADFDLDGKLDLLLTNAQDAYFFHGNGDGTFAATPGDLSQGSSPRYVATGDFNRDGIPDIIIASSDSKKIIIRMGNGDGSFTSGSDRTTSNFPQSILVGDFNGDGKLDLAVTGSTNTVAILSGDGDGTFTGGSSFAIKSPAVTAVAGDFNGDGRLDIVAGSSSSVLSILLNASAFTFGGALAAKTDFALTADAGGHPATDPLSIAAGDFDNDGNLDLAVANSVTSNVSVFLGNGAGSLTLTTASPFDAGTGASAIAVGDFNRDGVLDLAVVNSGAGNVSIFIGNGDGTFDPASTPTVGVGTTPVAAVTGDWDGDGKLDLAVANSGDDTVSILLGNGDGTFTASGAPSTGAGPHGVAVGDFNGDGKLDLAVANQTDGSVSILLGTGSGTFAAHSDFTADTGSVSVAAGDFNGDGILDLAVANSGNDNVSILIGNGDGTFDPAVNFAAGNSPSALLAADFNRDGVLDLAVSNRLDDTVSILIGNGAGSFSGAFFGSPFAVGSAPAALAAGDFDGDGRLDVATANQNTDNVSVLLNTAPPPTILSPAASDVWTITTVKTIRWSFNGGGATVNILLSRDGGAFKTIVKKTPNDGSQSWTVTGPATSVNGAVIRVCSTAKGGPCAPDSDPFTIQ
jgi:VCBS repeat protein/FG-GAP repeat protein